jgi:hypothetical protein
MSLDKQKLLCWKLEAIYLYWLPGSYTHQCYNNTDNVVTEEYMSEKDIYKVVFFNQKQVYEIYAKHVYQGDMYGFVIVEDFVFGEKSAIVVDPSEDKLRSEFNGVKRSFIPMHEVIRIDQVKKQGLSKIISTPKESDGSGKVANLYKPDK